jgi:hypothetical protein
MNSITSCIKYFESTRGKLVTPDKEVEEVYCGPVLTDFAKDLIERVENKKRVNAYLTKCSPKRKSNARKAPR